MSSLRSSSTFSVWSQCQVSDCRLHTAKMSVAVTHA